MEFSPSHCSHVVPFSLSLVEERGQVPPNGNWLVDLGSLVDEHLIWWVCLHLSENKEEFKGTEKNLKELNKNQNSHVSDILYKTKENQ